MPPFPPLRIFPINISYKYRHWSCPRARTAGLPPTRSRGRLWQTGGGRRPRWRGWSRSRWRGRRRAGRRGSNLAVTYADGVGKPGRAYLIGQGKQFPSLPPAFPTVSRPFPSVCLTYLTDCLSVGLFLFLCVCVCVSVCLSQVPPSPPQSVSL
jgi:hypothetical protein